MKIYLDNCCFNRPFDDQSHLRIRLESEAKLYIQDSIRSGIHTLVWSYIADYENTLNPFLERREQIAKWRGYAQEYCGESTKILAHAVALNEVGIKKMDALHIACAMSAKADYFLTVDDGILKKSTLIEHLRISDPIGFIKEVSS